MCALRDHNNRRDKVLRVRLNDRRIQVADKVGRNNRRDKRQLGRFSRVLHVQLNDHRIRDVGRVDHNKRNPLRLKPNHARRTREEDKVRCNSNRNSKLRQPRVSLRVAGRARAKSLKP